MHGRVFDKTQGMEGWMYGLIRDSPMRVTIAPPMAPPVAQMQPQMAGPMPVPGMAKGGAVDRKDMSAAFDSTDRSLMSEHYKYRPTRANGGSVKPLGHSPKMTAGADSGAGRAEKAHHAKSARK